MRFTAALLALCLTGCTLTDARWQFRGALAADAATTAVGLSQGAQEVNPVLRPAPVPLLLASGVLVEGAAWLAERAGAPKAALWIYRIGIVTHGGAAISNAAQIAGASR